MSGTAPSNWNLPTLDDSTWTSVVVPSPTTETSGTQYFRIHFDGQSGLAAYELNLKYRFGVIAYINGNEIYRDNMPAGEVTPTTQATGSYSQLEYHKMYRSAGEVIESNMLLAVELHFMEQPQTVVDFNAWMMIHASSMPQSEEHPNQCYMLPPPSSVISEIDPPENSFDLNQGTLASAFGQSDYFIVSYPFQAMVNAYGAWHPRGRTYGYPTRVTLGGITSATPSASSPSEKFLTGGKHLTDQGVYPLDYAYFNRKTYRSFRLNILETGSTYRVHIIEHGFFVCSLTIPTSMEFNPSTYTGKKDLTELSIAPSLAGFYSCSVEPALPQGLTLNEETCTISGIPTEAKTGVYTMTSRPDGFAPITGSFTLNIDVCTGAILEHAQNYRNSREEGFRLKRVDNDEVVYDSPPESAAGRPNDWSTRFCAPAGLVVAEVYGIEQWGTNTFASLFTYSGEKKEQLFRGSRSAFFTIVGTAVVNTGFTIKEGEDWYYKMGSVPANWYNDQTSGWQSSHLGSFPESTNRFQLYKKTFSLASIDQISSFSMSIRYRFAAVVYINNQKVFQIGFSGDLSDQTTTEHVYQQADYYYFTKSIYTYGGAENTPILNVGNNVIAVGLVSITDTQKASNFDATFLLLAGDETIRSFQMQDSYGGTFGQFSNAFGNYAMSAVSGYGCGPNFIEIQFENRMEALTSIEFTANFNSIDRVVKGATFLAKKEANEPWVQLVQSDNWKWWMVGQKKRVFLQNSEPYQFYRIENVTSYYENCEIQIQYLDLIIDNYNREIPALEYTSQEVFQNIEIAEIFPSSEFYFDFHVTPDLPTGLSLDMATGAIVGTPTELTPSTVYTITAKKPSGQEASCNVTLSVAVCTGGRSLITATISTDTSPSIEYYRLHEGRTTEGRVVREENSLYMASGNNLLYADFCVPHGIYTLEHGITNGYWGLNFPCGHSLSVDVGTLRLDVSYFDPQTPVASHSFSSYIPFQINFDDWKFYKLDAAIPAEWNMASFDDSQWTVGKAADLGNVQPVTAYIRRTFTIPSLEDYHVLNVHTRYSGGLAAYFNGRLVARFNLGDTFHADTPALSAHDPKLYSKFHVVLVTSGAVAGEGLNVIAFEEHRAADQSSSEEMTFDATGVFEINDCSPVVDSYQEITGTPTTSGSLENLFDLYHSTLGTLESAVGTYVEWTVENLEGSKFNSFGIHADRDLTLGFSLYGRYQSTDDYTTIYENVNANVVQALRSSYPMAVGYASFNNFRFEIDVQPSSTLRASEFVAQYCKATGLLCPGIGDYPPVVEGEISPSTCPEKFTGYSFRSCIDGQLGEVNTTYCIPKLPANLHYQQNFFQFVLNTQVSTGDMIYDNMVSEFFFDEQVTLPEGLTLNTATGEISGVPTKEHELTTYRVYAKNARGASYVDINVLVRKGRCAADGVFDATEIDTTAVYECSKRGSYIGTQKRHCKLGAVDGEWEKSTGMCVSVFALVVAILIVIVILVVVVFVLIRTSKKAKSVGGVKGKKVAAATDKKAPAKATKV